VRCGCVVDLLVVALAAADGVVLRRRAHRLEGVEVVQPLLQRDEAAAV
jgi:hypothetical protein